MGFTAIQPTSDLVSAATTEQIDTLQKLTERYCVVYQTLRHGPVADMQMMAGK